MVNLLIVPLTLLLVGFAWWALQRIRALESQNRQLDARLRTLERERNGTVDTAPAVEPEPVPVVPVAMPAPPVIPVRPAELRPVAPPVMPVPPPAVAPPLRPVPAPAAAGPRRNWEQFTGAKLFAWIGGFAAFLGAAFFIKYSFEHDLIPPALRVALGYAFGLALIGVGLRLPRPRYAPTAHTLCATGVVCLYAVTFACNSIYHFEFFGPVSTFLVMALVTAGAFLLAVRLGAQVVAVLGLVGGFLTPVLLASGRDNAFGLFGYVALLDAGLVALALHQRWHFLVPLGAAGTVAMQVGWALNFLQASRVPVAMVIGLFFSGFFAGARLVSRRLERSGPAWRWPALLLPVVGLLFGLSFLGFRSVAEQPALLFGFVLAIDACLLAIAWNDDASSRAHLIGGFGAFGLLAVWTGARLTPPLLPWALGLYLVFGSLHTVFPLLLARRRPGRSAAEWGQWFPALALGLMLVPLLKLDQVPFLVWPAVLLIDLLAIALALVGGSILAVTAALILTVAATALWIFRLPSAWPAEPWSVLAVVGGFAALFFAAGAIFVARRPTSDASGHPLADPRVQLPVMSSLMPFFLLVMLVQRLPGAASFGIFSLGLALVLMGLALTLLVRAPWLPACSLAGITGLVWVWEALHPGTALLSPFGAWILGFYAIFTLFPFVFRRRLAGETGPSAVAALAGVAFFPLVLGMVRRFAPSDSHGLVPAFFALAPLASLAIARRDPAFAGSARTNQLAWFGGTALLFLTLVFPIQFNRQWITLGWALEGTALLWLYRRVSHPGLRAVGVILLIAAFTRLALNPAILSYHPRGEIPILNWFLYTYGIVTVCLFGGAALTTGPQDRTLGVPIRPLLCTLGTILAFLLLNLEIADYFHPAGAPVFVFRFSGNFARDMAYTIGWALFALALLLASIWRSTRAGRYAALALLAVAVVKLFFHDLEHLGALHRIGALFAVAVIAIAASLAYQRFLPGDDARR